jgi:DNA repair exonuclease SbcCD nuclease subunit
MKYYGALTERVLDEYSRKIRKNGFTIFMTHVGIEGYLNLYGCISSNKLHKLKGKVDYVALGHIHKSFVEDNFIFNPGSLETCDITELEFRRGFFYVEVDDGIKYELIENNRRDFVLLNCKIESPDYEELRQFLIKHRRNTQPVVDLTINTTRSVRKMLDEDKIKRIVKEVFDPIVVRIKWNIEDGFYSVKLNFENRDSIERSVIKQILENYDYGDIVEEVLRLKSIFCSSFNVAMVDRLVDDIIEAEEKVENGEKAEGFGKFESLDLDTERAERKAKSVEDLRLRKPILRLTDLMDVEPSKPKAKAKVEERKVEEEEEVWDWRKAYDKRGKARKR